MAGKRENSFHQSVLFRVAVVQDQKQTLFSCDLCQNLQLFPDIPALSPVFVLGITEIGNGQAHVVAKYHLKIPAAG